MSRLPGYSLKKSNLIFFQIIALLQIWTLKIFNQENSKRIIARSFKLGQLIEDNE